MGFATLSYIIAICTAGSLTLNVIGAICVATLFGIWWIFDRYRRLQCRVRLEVRSPKPAKGLILLLSPYRVKGVENLEEKVKFLATPGAAVQASDFDAISIQASNLYPQLCAITYHQKTLREVWLICSDQSFQTGFLLKEYIRVVYGSETISVNHRSEYIVNPYFDDQLFRVAEDIFATTDIKSRAMIADITGGFATMSVSLAMACVTPGRRMQYMESPRDDQGEPIQSAPLRPIELDFDPVLHWGDDLTRQTVD
ncbi:intracellular growth attenuator family protein [Lyngbya confervoides]|uniref:Intracellular growth attenuator family protein n=1 Tax=Lyngbya confervoides BDU141951 TaxID=1574623 RepID=A0ABD4T4K1_9CYAN|nr:intracellular growth attenuator family protein [Lyngbya confervoides]MCM1983751.1 intracellular growth attenuator family protein [Lyngbya confervoides BDU141951]